ncbi:molybdopterin-dependent oxidoreductase [Aquabacterium sp. A08]|uniref:molybdopterin-dependent oxidoreductase n=1 Tax=Aquabacterium sp. A08 TaxID=2718532 RepID=UPI00141F6888|nr:molybdopterin-dependent oxidoreductase [Aquabacterium sp. A08]NIC43008.1 molybdopterin-dependent oxidoreductase [Aquabacterium sp. A08]
MNTSRTRRLGLGLTIAALLGPLGWVSAHALGQPQGKPVLTVGGAIAATNRGGQAVFDMAMLEALPQKTFTTSTPWDNRPIRFSGPLLRDVLAAVQARTQAGTLKATALNDYRIQIPVADAARFDVIMATRLDGEPMSVRTRGPLFIVYPFDSRPELQSATYYERSIWQLKSLDVE